jgi:hypothetical protein
MLPVAIKGYGVLDKRYKRPVTAATFFQVGSISKLAVISRSIAHLVSDSFRRFRGMVRHVTVDALTRSANHLWMLIPFTQSVTANPSLLNSINATIARTQSADSCRSASL